MKNLDWRVVGAACAVMTVEGFDLASYGGVLPLLLKDQGLGLTTGSAGWVGSAVFVGMLLGGLAVGRLTARFERRHVLIAGVALFSVAMLAAALAPGVWWLGIARVFAGLGLGVVMPICMAIGRAACGRESAPLGISAIMAGIPLGGVIATALTWAGIGQYGWRVVFGLGAVLGPLALGVMLAVLRSRPEELTTEAGAAGSGAGASAAGVAAPAPLARRLHRADMLPAVVGALATFFFLLSFYGVMTWLTKLMTVLQLPLSGALQVTLTLNVGAVVGSLLTGLLAVRHGAAAVTVASGLIGAICLVLVPSGAVSGVALLVVVALLGMVSPSTQNLVNTMVADLVPEERRAAVLGVTLGVGRLGAVLAPIVGSQLLGHVATGHGLTGSAGAVFTAFAVSSVLGVLTAVWLARVTARRRAENQAPAGGGRRLEPGGQTSTLA